MITVATVLAVIAGLAHVAIFAIESLLFHRRPVQRLFGVRRADAPGVHSWAFNQGFYNLFLAVGAFVGVGAWLSGQDLVGRTLIVFSCAAMALAGVVLFFSRRRLWRGALGQFVPAATAVIATLAA